MGAKKKPQETLVARRPRRRRRRRRRGRVAHRGARARPAAAARRLAQDRGRRQRRRSRSSSSSSRSGCCDATLVFLEHHDGELQKGALGVLVEGRVARRRTSPGVVLGSGVRELAPSRPGKYGAATVYVADDAALDGAAAAAARRRPRGARPRRRASTPCSSARRCSPPTSPPVSPRGSTRASTGTSSTSRVDGRRAGRQAARAPGLGLRRRRLDERRRGSGSFRSGTFDPVETGGDARGRGVRGRVRGLLAARATMVEQAHAESEGPSIEDADIIVAGGRGLGKPENFTLVEELAKALGGAVAATRAVVDAGWYPYATQVGQTGKTRRRRSSTSPAASPARSSTRSGCRARA